MRSAWLLVGAAAVMAGLAVVLLLVGLSEPILWLLAAPMGAASYALWSHGRDRMVASVYELYDTDDAVDPRWTWLRDGGADVRSHARSDADDTRRARDHNWDRDWHRGVGYTGTDDRESTPDWTPGDTDPERDGPWDDWEWADEAPRSDGGRDTPSGHDGDRRERDRPGGRRGGGGWWEDRGADHVDDGHWYPGGNDGSTTDRRRPGGADANGRSGATTVDPRTARACEILGVDADADRATIRAAYRERVKEVHPDCGGDEAAFKRVRRAYEHLIERVEP